MKIIIVAIWDTEQLNLHGICCHGKSCCSARGNDTLRAVSLRTAPVAATESPLESKSSVLEISKARRTLLQTATVV